MKKTVTVTNVKGKYIFQDGGEVKENDFEISIPSRRKLKDSGLRKKVEELIGVNGLYIFDKVNVDTKTYFMEDEDFINAATIINDKEVNEYE